MTTYVATKKAVIGEIEPVEGGYLFRSYDRSKYAPRRKPQALALNALPEFVRYQAMLITADSIAEARFRSIRDALCWTATVRPDVAPPTASDGDRKGWLFNAYGERVDRACTSSVSHAFGRDDKTTTQKPKALYSTRLLALRALRNAVESEAAEKLSKIDNEIADEEVARG